MVKTLRLTLSSRSFALVAGYERSAKCVIAVSNPNSGLIWLQQVKPYQMQLDENLSRAGQEHSSRAIKKLAEEIVENQYWDPPSASTIDKKHQTFKLTSGYKRWHSALLLDKQGRLPPCVGNADGIQVIIYKGDEGETELRNNAINAAENLDRENPNPYQTAITFYTLHTRHGLTVDELHKRFSSFKPVTIKNYIRLIRQLIPEIIDEWRLREGSEKPISLAHLLRWCTLTPDKQEDAFNAYKKQPLRFKRNYNDRRRSMHAIQLRLTHETDPGARKALLWVIQEDEDDGDYRNDGREPLTRTINGRRIEPSGSASHGGNHRMWEGREGRPNGSSDDDPGAISSGSTSYSRGNPKHDAALVEKATSGTGRAPRNAGRKRP